MTDMGKIYGEFAFDRKPIRLYWYAGLLIAWGTLTAMVALGTSGVGLVIFPIGALLSHWWINRVFRRLYYEVDEDSTNIRRGVIFHVEKVIPLEKITDIKLIQGPLMRCFGVYNLLLQTAGTGAQVAEAVMTFESREKAVEVRERIMEARRRFRALLLRAGTGDD